MEFEQFLAILKKAKRMGIAIISFTGGEPLLWPHLNRAIAACTKENIVTGVTTNGLLLSFQRIDELANAGLDQLIVSIDSVGKNPQSQKSLSDNPKLLKYMEYAKYEKEILVSANCVLSRKNAGDIDNLVKTLSRAGIPISIGFMDEPTEPSKDDIDPSLSFSYPRDSKLLRNIVQHIIQMKRSNLLIIEPERYFLDYIRHLQKERVWDCRKSKKFSLQIAPNGQIFICTRRNLSPYHFASINKKSYKHLKEIIFKSIATCNPQCYCNCSYNNFYYQSHPVEFIVHVVFPILREHRWKRKYYSKISHPFDTMRTLIK